ncbi:MAG: DUF523 domain-containing protein [Clostridiales bacterium]|nr:DUF523 domain-containing protein [Candidatus Crickella merdequi]
MYIISKCFLGHNCKYNGGNNLDKNVVEFCESHSYALVCPEVTGGLTTPRFPSEQRREEDGSFRVYDTQGTDVTDNFVNGADTELEIIIREATRFGELIEGAVLKARSPSCGHEVIYDGTFSSTKVKGNGVFVERLIEAQHCNKEIFADNFRILSEDEL